MNKSFEFKIVDGFDHTIDEKQGGNTFIALRKIQWGDSEKTYLDLRKWFNTKDGSETPGKGVSFMDEVEGPKELINVFLQNGYGDTKQVLHNIKDRSDFRSSLNSVLDNDDDLYDKSIPDEEEEEYYDPKEALI